MEVRRKPAASNRLVSSKAAHFWSEDCDARSSLAPRAHVDRGTVGPFGDRLATERMRAATIIFF